MLSVFLVWAIATGRVEGWLQGAGFERHYKVMLCERGGLSASEREQARAAGLTRDMSEESRRRRKLDRQYAGNDAASQRRRRERREECWSRDVGRVQPEKSALPEGAHIKSYYKKEAGGEG
ncbi:hypothetical protein FRC98_11900 [Lujinxingia vulgaris]|uniref:Uncharacterized protein n=1 Tax=Lujinxingia vulgaris TaxID=2600176 RepID=A0A5C6X3Z3_9DELT|nr:hypothetical protein [Lujinxingia vulgaris]TXD36535.1 hypothetical protein FRC98_11900 [Lujinxingia vulgaris]